MIHVNLLPYRNARRQNEILQHLGVAFGVIGLAALISLTAQWVATSDLSSLQDEFTQIKAQNQILKKKIGKIKDLDALRSDVERKLELVDRLQEGRFRSLKTLYEMARVIPENVWLKSIADSGDTIRITGLGESNKAVANFMRELDGSDIFSNVNLQVISRVDAVGVPVRDFTLTLNRDDGKPAAKKAAAKKPAAKKTVGGAS